MLYKNGDKITAYASGLTGGDRLYVALYEERNGTQRLADIAVVSADGNGFAFYAFDNKSNFKAKAFVWSADMGIRLAKTIE